ncbi:MAG: hypothetical protein WCH03_01945 [Flavobacteriia bacterium]
MSQHSHTSIFTTASGVLGGVAKAVTAKPILTEITLPGLSNVVIYAAASAAAGYIVKKSMDCMAKRLSDYLNKQKESRCLRWFSVLIVIHQ